MPAQKWGSKLNQFTPADDFLIEENKTPKEIVVDLGTFQCLANLVKESILIKGSKFSSLAERDISKEAPFHLLCWWMNRTTCWTLNTCNWESGSWSGCTWPVDSVLKVVGLVICSGQMIVGQTWKKVTIGTLNTCTGAKSIIQLLLSMLMLRNQVFLPLPIIMEFSPVASGRNCPNSDKRSS